jgi:hypothetical protein
VTHDEATGVYAVGGVPVVLSDIALWHAGGQIAWANPELGRWAASLAAPSVIDRRGAWCPHCGNRDSVRKTRGCGCVLMVFLFISVIGILALPFLPKEWHCRVCGHMWRG